MIVQTFLDIITMIKIKEFCIEMHIIEIDFPYITLYPFIIFTKYLDEIYLNKLVL